MQIKNCYLEFSRLGEYAKSMSLFFARLVVAYGFYEPAMMKWYNGKHTTPPTFSHHTQDYTRGLKLSTGS